MDFVMSCTIANGSDAVSLRLCTVEGRCVELTSLGVKSGSVENMLLQRNGRPQLNASGYVRWTVGRKDRELMQKRKHRRHLAGWLPTGACGV